MLFKNHAQYYLATGASRTNKYMSEKDINKKAYEQAEKEMLESKIEEIKGFIKETLEKIEIDDLYNPDV